MKILVIDDEDVIKIITEKVLTKKGHTVLTASSSETGLELLKENLIDLKLVILDLDLNGESGMDLFHELRKLHSDLPVLFSSGSEINFEALGISDTAYVGILEKPYGSATLLAKIEQMIPA